MILNYGNFVCDILYICDYEALENSSVSLDVSIHEVKCYSSFEFELLFEYLCGERRIIKSLKKL